MIESYNRFYPQGLHKTVKITSGWTRVQFNIYFGLWMICNNSHLCRDASLESFCSGGFSGAGTYHMHTHQTQGEMQHIQLQTQYD